MLFYFLLFSFRLSNEREFSFGFFLAELNFEDPFNKCAAFPFPTKFTVHYKIAYTFVTSLLRSLRTAFCFYRSTHLRPLGCLWIYSFLHFLSYSQHLCISKLREWQTYGLFKDTYSAYSQGNISSDLQHH